MIRYFFHVMDGKIAIDENGLEFANDAEARHQALIAASEMLVDREIELWVGNTWRMTVAKENGVIVCNLRFSIDQPITTASSDHPMVSH